MKAKKLMAAVLATVLAVGMTACGEESGSNGGGQKITNVSYDPTRELYAEYNEAFVKHYKEETGKDVEVIQSHGGSGKQARSVVEGADADVVTLALEHDITMIEEAGMIEPGWINEFDLDSSPYTSTIVFLVRKGNPKNLTDWDSLTADGVDVITPDPKSSGGAMWNFLAAWQYIKEKSGNNETEMKDFMRKLYGNVSVMDSGARGATTTFVENGHGDVLIAWENEAINTLKEYPDDYEMITPSISILAQPSVAIVDENAKKDGVEELCKDYLNYLYTDEAQEIIAKNGYRPSNQEILNKYGDKFDLNVKLCTIQDFGGWNQAYDDFFADGKIFDEIYTK
ncbi:MAG: sulfate ABC transporter substrate-binding protein [Eubacterium sp.]|nr:sulfate ABC transporter substrate-binding protein [Eubacterium sp.]